MKKFVLPACVLAILLSICPAAYADYESGAEPLPPAGQAASYNELVTEVIVSQTVGAPESSTNPAPIGMAPVAENQEIETYRGVSVGGKLSARDPEGGALRFEISTQPMKGTVQLAADGHFVYSPAEGKRGKDYFGFRATDEQGNLSQEGTVIITLLRQKGRVSYSDLEGEACAYSATVLAEKDIFVGEQLGADYVFHPEQPISRGEFLSMCMVLTDEDILSGAVSTGFLDDDAIELWLKPYVSTALMEGYISGTGAQGGASFQAADAIRLGDACSMLDAVLGVSNVSNFGSDVGSQAVANLSACGVLGEYESLESSLTRGEAAEMLAAALKLVEAR